MAKKIKQFRYYGEGNENNQPTTIVGSNNIARTTTYLDFMNGNVFASYYPIVQLGIQAMPGTKFYLNNAIQPIIVGYTGIYELDLEGSIEISKLTFDRNSLEKINELNNGLLLVDIIYDDGTAEG